LPSRVRESAVSRPYSKQRATTMRHTALSPSRQDTFFPSA
jgi:hypothetical protein